MTGTIVLMIYIGVVGYGIVALFQRTAKSRLIAGVVMLAGTIGNFVLGVLLWIGGIIMYGIFGSLFGYVDSNTDIEANYNGLLIETGIIPVFLLVSAVLIGLTITHFIAAGRLSKGEEKPGIESLIEPDTRYPESPKISNT